MKIYYHFTILMSLFIVISVSNLQAQKILSGEIYLNGELAENILVEAQYGGTNIADSGKYIIKRNEESQWLRFTYLSESPSEFTNKSKTIDISDLEGDEFNFEFNGPEPFDNNVIIQFTEMSPDLGDMLWLVVKDKSTGNERDNTNITVKDEFLLNVTGIIPGKSYDIDFFIDDNQNWNYDTPPADPAWRVELNNITNDTTLMFSYNPDFTDVNWTGYMSNDTNIYFIVEEMPEFPGGEQALRDYISQSMVYPDSAKKEGLQGRVFVSFVVEKDGTAGNVKITRGIDPLLDAEALRIIESMPIWETGYQRNVPVRVSYTVPVNFVLPTSTWLAENPAKVVKIYPNPTSRYVYIELDKSYPELIVSINNMAGQEIIRKPFSPNQRFKLELKDVASGMFFVKLILPDERRQTVFKIIKQ